ncbi:MAG: EAL domain-containing protein [Pseudomonadota bacterium]
MASVTTIVEDEHSASVRSDTAKNALAVAERRLRDVQRVARIGSWELDLTSDEHWWSEEALNVFEPAVGIRFISYADFLERVHPEDRALVDKEYQASIADPHYAYDVIFRLKMADNRQKFVHGRCEHDWNEQGEAIRSLGTVQDITDRVLQEQRLKNTLAETARLKEYTSHVVQNSPSFIVAINPAGETLEINSAGCRIMGWRRQDILGKDLWRAMYPGEKYAQVEHLFKEFEAHGGVRGHEMVTETANGDERIISWTSVNRYDEFGQVLEVIGIGEDVTDLKASQAELEHLAHHDALTGLPNRLMFNARLDIALTQAERRKTIGAVLFVDLDRFKNINDSLGHAAGDELLKQAAIRLRNCLRDDDTVARLGGDEFTLLLEDIRDSSNANLVAAKVLRSFKNPFILHGNSLVITPSIGICLFPDNGRDIDTLLRNADAALYQAKELGRNAYALYSGDLTRQAQERMQLENSLRQALDRDELLLHYQPQIDMRSGEIIGAEALIRWNHPEHGLVSPAKFIPAAEESGLIVPIGEWVLNKACDQMSRWREDGSPIKRVAVNVAGPQFQRGDLLWVTEKALTSTSLPPKCLELEVTEGFIMSRAESAISLLHDLRALGVTLAIDDFGTGYSSLSYLKRLPIDQIKIDKSFVKDLPDNGNDMAIARAVIALCRSLQLTVLAEGVEEQTQRHFLLSNGCHFGQGYLFFRPQTAEEIDRLLNLRAVSN